METLYSHQLHTYSPHINTSAAALATQWGSRGSVAALGVVLGSSVSLVGLAFAFITYSLFSDLRSLAGTALLSLLASSFMAQLLFVIGVGGIQDPELCFVLSLAFLFMKLSSLCWITCCCHQALRTFRHSVNLILCPEPKMCRLLVEYNCFSWGFPLLMIGIAVAFKCSEATSTQQLHIPKFTDADGLIAKHCWITEGPAYIWSYMVPAIFILFIGFHLAYQAKQTAKLSAQMQVDVKARRKLIKRRLLQCGLFIKLLFVFASVNIFGSLAALFNIAELWIIYSIAQGIQGLIIALLVTCNCRVLKLYTASRKHKIKKGFYENLREGEGGRYGVLTVTNPNYNEGKPIDPILDGNDKPEDINGTFVASHYEDETLLEKRVLNKDVLQTLEAGNDIIDSLPVSALQLSPLPQSV